MPHTLPRNNMMRTFLSTSQTRHCLQITARLAAAVAEVRLSLLSSAI